MTFRQSSATSRALVLIAEGMTAYRAAKTVGIALSTIYRALRRQRQAARGAKERPVGQRPTQSST